MPLIKDGRIVADRYVRLADDAALPPAVPAIISAARLMSGADARRHTAALGVLWPNHRNVGDLAGYLDRLSMVALMFPTFRDGRAYSQARLLRERHGFRGELRATGQVLRDQFLFLIRAGFDALEVAKDADADAFAAAVARYSVFYQAAGDGRLPVARRRLASITAQAPHAIAAQS